MPSSPLLSRLSLAAHSRLACALGLRHRATVPCSGSGRERAPAAAGQERGAGAGSAVRSCCSRGACRATIRLLRASCALRLPELWRGRLGLCIGRTHAECGLIVRGYCGRFRRYAEFAEMFWGAKIAQLRVHGNGVRWHGIGIPIQTRVVWGVGFGCEKRFIVRVLL